MNANLRIAIIEPSIIIRNGLSNLLRKLSSLSVSVSEILENESLTESLRLHKPDILIANPQSLHGRSFHHLKEESGCTDMKLVALVSNLYPEEWLRPYDEQISLYDEQNLIKQKIERLIVVEEENADGANEEQQSLSAREKEIVVCVVKGMTNREIAARLFLSTHTVITHRRNIARKLQIHSPSGLTIYAIVNKLVELSDIKQ